MIALTTVDWIRAEAVENASRAMVINFHLMNYTGNLRYKVTKASKRAKAIRHSLNENWKASLMNDLPIKISEPSTDDADEALFVKQDQGECANPLGQVISAIEEQIEGLGEVLSQLRRIDSKSGNYDY